MQVLVVVYIAIGIVAGFIGTETEKRQTYSHGILFLGAIVSLATYGPFVIAAVAEMAVGFFVAMKIKEHRLAIFTFIKRVTLVSIVLASVSGLIFFVYGQIQANRSEPLGNSQIPNNASIDFDGTPGNRWRPHTSQKTFHGVAENGDQFGRDNDGDGRDETVYVEGYTRGDGTYVRSHYRAQRR